CARYELFGNQYNFDYW
nr:immunoglobulin heavy chain junction region [Macaca mulatta]MOX62760.1 immunoglobulin heavy chain junction region [Macaca mulatta]